MKNSIRMHDLWFKRSDSEWVFEGVNVDLAFDHGVIMLLGPSGSGKSTLLYLLAGLLRPSSGELTVNGYSLDDSLSEATLTKYRTEECTLMFQNYPAIEWLTVYENVHLESDDPKRISQYLARLDLIEKKDKYPSRISFGQKQRLAIVQSLLSQCNIVLLDEPTSALDSDNKHRVLELVKETAVTQNTLIIIATHDLELQKYADAVFKITKTEFVKLK